MRFLKWILFFLILMGFGACGGNPNPLAPTPPVPVFGNFVLGVATSRSPEASPSQNPSAPQPLSPAALPNSFSIDGGGIHVTETRQIASQISFKPDNGPSSDIQFPGTFVVQLIQAGQITDLEFPDFGITNIPLDTYHSFEMRFDLLASSEIPSELLEDVVVTQLLVGHNLIVEGSFTLSASVLNLLSIDQEIPFTLFSDQATSIRVSSPNAFLVSPTQVNYFFIAFQINHWFQGIFPLLQNITPADLTNGTLVISKDHPNPLIRQILSLFEQNLDQSLKSAPSTDAVFQENDLDPLSSSVPF